MAPCPTTEADSAYSCSSQSRDSTRSSRAYLAPRLNAVALKHSSKSEIWTSPRLPSLTGMACSLGGSPDGSRPYGSVVSPAAKSGDGSARSRKALTRRVRVRAWRRVRRRLPLSMPADRSSAAPERSSSCSIAASKSSTDIRADAVFGPTSRASMTSAAPPSAAPRLGAVRSAWARPTRSASATTRAAGPSRRRPRPRRRLSECGGGGGGTTMTGAHRDRRHQPGFGQETARRSGGRSAASARTGPG